jgi:hypothetical protein
MAAPVISIVGMRALRRDIKRQTDEQSSALYTAIKRAGRQAAEPVAALTRANLPHVTGRLAGDVRVTASRTGAAVRMGRKSVPYAGWVEFGGTRKRPHLSEREYVRTGRYLFPAARGLAERSAQLYAEGLERVLGAGATWTNTTVNPAQVHD